MGPPHAHEELSVSLLLSTDSLQPPCQAGASIIPPLQRKKRLSFTLRVKPTLFTVPLQTLYDGPTCCPASSPVPFSSLWPSCPTAAGPPRLDLSSPFCLSGSSSVSPNVPENPPNLPVKVDPPSGSLSQPQLVSLGALMAVHSS